MAKIRHLISVAVEGYRDMAPALGQAFNDSPDDDRLQEVFGQRPRRNILLLSLACVLLGHLVAWLTENWVIAEAVNWPAVAVGVIFAVLFRRFLFDKGGADRSDFPWLAASMIPAVAMLVAGQLVVNIISGEAEPVEGGPFWTFIGYIAEVLARSCSVAAAVAMAVAALTYSRRWVTAVKELAMNLIAFLVLLWFTAFMMFEVEIMDRILSAIMESVFGITFPSWIGDFADQISYAVLLLAFYFSIMGGTWMVCRQEFGTLLETGEVDIIKAVKTLLDPPTEKQLKKQAAKRAKKIAKAEQKAAKARKTPNTD